MEGGDSFASQIEELSQNYGKIFPHHFFLRKAELIKKKKKKKVKKEGGRWCSACWARHQEDGWNFENPNQEAAGSSRWQGVAENLETHQARRLPVLVGAREGKGEPNLVQIWWLIKVKFPWYPKPFKLCCNWKFKCIWSLDCKSLSSLYFQYLSLEFSDFML